MNTTQFPGTGITKAHINKYCAGMLFGKWHVVMVDGVREAE